MYNKFSTLLRIFYYNDAHMGYGDAGTFRYVRVTKEEFTKETVEYFGGETATKHKPTPELVEKLISLGYDYYTMGYDFSTEKKYAEEVTKLRIKLERLETL